MILKLPRKMAVKTIELYQKTLSPDHGIVSGNSFIGCRYYPSCSEYTKRSIQKRGVLAGSIKGAWRILRCNPFSAGGVDESY